MSKPATAAMHYERTPITRKPRTTLTRKSLYRESDKFSQLPTHEVLRRLYKRHSVGVWMTLTAAIFVYDIWNKLG